MRALILITSLMLSGYSLAASLELTGAYARATPPNAPTSAIFLQLSNPTERSISLISANTPAAGRVELHTMIMDGDVMKMRQIEKIEVPAHSTVELKPGGLHLMLFDLQHAFEEGQQLSLDLHFSDGSQQHIKLPVKKVMLMKNMQH
ncbi:copper chaperone PCu(A)C [Agarivorans sp.]|uniref:copper chaperone PCu(A)C n=1 Tax=Agarivorans sp. TaxID=1872412 RepID=UPI003CFEA1E2